ncbi:MAG: TetR/AcrR family transcriptional regulator [Firmicutes bacterium]|nr:TetR/AcrR family transcriptional regulator [Bacillota bacterium]
MKEIPKKTRLSRAEAKARTREELLKAARVVFARYGFHATSLDMVAETAGYTKGAVYANFSGKDDLYLALLDNHLAGGHSDLEELIASGVSFGSISDETTENFFAELEDIRDWASLTVEFFVHAMRDVTIREKLTERIRVAQDYYTRCLEKRIAATGAELPMSVEQTATALLAFSNALYLLALLNPQPELPGIYVKMLKSLLG